MTKPLARARTRNAGFDHAFVDDIQRIRKGKFRTVKSLAEIR